MRGRWTAWLLTGSLALLGGDAGAFTVYHSDDGGTTPTLPATITNPGSLELHLYFDHGSTVGTGTPCLDGTGDHVCGWDLHVVTTGGVAVDPNSWVPNGDVVANVQGTSIRFNGGTVSTGDLGPTKLADVTVVASGPGTVQLVGKNFVTAPLGLGVVGSEVLALTGSGPNDPDGDGVATASDNCPTLANTDQADTDTATAAGSGIGAGPDGVGDVCDNCLVVANPRITPLGFQTTTGGQLDDDADGFGNHCDADFNNVDNLINPSDLALFLAANGKKRSKSVCSGGDCDIYDINGVDNLINASDLARFLQLNGTKKGKKQWQKCAACPLP